MLEKKEDVACLDPYDPWVTAIGVKTKDWFYEGKLIGKLLAVLVAVLDWLFPNMSRSLMGATKKNYPITVAQWILCGVSAESPKDQLKLLLDTATPDDGPHAKGWGLGFPWMSKNGLYEDNVPFVTHTPYAMEALLHLTQFDEIKRDAVAQFNDSLTFLDSLLVMHEDADSLALSYAPISEPRMVVNANSYGAMAYAMHAVHNASATEAKDRAVKLARWVVQQQNADGSWHYYADQEPGNFIDCFHSCFVLKNLTKAGKLIPEIEALSREALMKGFDYIQKYFFDQNSGLVKRFVERDIKDPYVWDLYDQAEYLGVLIDLGKWEEASAFQQHVENIFKRGEKWYCRKDMFGRLWGENFYRWGIMPFIYQCARLQRANKEDVI